MLRNNQPFVVAADIGGTHITSAVVDTRDWSILPESMVRNAVDSSASAKTIFHTWSNTLAISSQYLPAKTTAIGIAIPGPFDYDNGLSLMHNQDKYDALYKLDVKKELGKALGIAATEICFINDAAAFLQGEVFAGKQNGHPKILGITLGTGLGSSIWEKGKNAVDADLWDTPYQDSIMEEYLVTRWFVRSMANRTGIQVSGLRELLLLRDEHPMVDEILEEYTHHLAHFLTYFCNKENSNTVILGGNISKAWPIFHSIDASTFNKFDIKISKLGEDAALIGAAAVFGAYE